jgi:hypothetical protein
MVSAAQMFRVAALRHNFDHARHRAGSRRRLAIRIAQVNSAVVSEGSYFGKSPGYGLSRGKIVGVK